MRILLTGATGFTGSRVFALLGERGITPRCLVRSGSDPQFLQALRNAGAELAEGDIGDRDSLLRALDGIDTLLNIASLGFGHAAALVGAAEEAGVSRAVFVSTTALFTRLNAKTKAIRIAAEDTIRASRLAWTIVRPTMIYGSARDRNMVRLIRLIRRSPVIPVAGNGKRLQQPVFVDDVARAVILAMDTPAAVGRAYNISGAQPLTLNEVIDTIAELLRRRVVKLHMPLRPVVASLALSERIGIRLPLKSEQVLRLDEDKSFDYAGAAADLGYAPLSFREGITLELRLLGLLP